MKKVFIVAAVAAMIVSSCGSKGNKSAEMIAESASDSLFAVNDSTLGDLQTYTYEGVLPGADVSGINYQLTLQEIGEDSLGTYNLTTTYLGANNGQDQVFTDSGTVVTIIGMPNDSTAIIYQLVSAAPGHEKTNFLAEGDSALTMVGKDFKKAVSKLNYTLKKKL
ncbi:copper resistance protein NlpE N-terminal domain-containing protein [Phocaeicola sp.]